uniref:Acyl-coenzyme A thioesterase THEM4 n=1 Tax=Anas platyrhynchos platyrhynchos TaxID=8840 RepID=A0A493T9D0_ANAPP
MGTCRDMWGHRVVTRVRDTGTWDGEHRSMGWGHGDVWGRVGTCGDVGCGTRGGDTGSRHRDMGAWGGDKGQQPGHVGWGHGDGGDAPLGTHPKVPLLPRASPVLTPLSPPLPPACPHIPLSPCPPLPCPCALCPTSSCLPVPVPVPVPVPIPLSPSCPLSLSSCPHPPVPVPIPQAPCSGRAAPQDLALPNGSWSRAMRELYERLLRGTADGSWRRVPSYRNVLDHFPAVGQGRGTRLFMRNLDTEGAGFEYVTFLHRAGGRALCLCQTGPYLEGPPGFTHGGAIASIIDTTLGTCALDAAGVVMTAQLSIDFLAPVPLGSVVLLDGRVDRREG